MSVPQTSAQHDVVIVGGGAAGLATAASLLKRRPNLNVAIIDPSDVHYYQPGWTMVGGGIFNQGKTVRLQSSVIPDGAKWIQETVTQFDSAHSQVRLSDGRTIGYRALVAAPGLKLDWDAIEGLSDALGRNSVTSNYGFDTAPYTWAQVQAMREGRALFTQPPMPIKCAGAPQKALYLSADHWRRQGHLKNIEIEFHNAGAALFGVAAYVPALMEYIRTYGVNLQFGSRLTGVDGASKLARFAVTSADGTVKNVEREFDFLHVCPPQTPLDIVRDSPLASEAGWIDVDEVTLQHKRFENVFGLGDSVSTSNAKTAAAARKQAPVVAENLLSLLDGKAMTAAYDGYGSCPLTVERGKIVLAEFGYGGKLLPSFPRWLLDGQKPSRLAWMLKSEALPKIYWQGMLKGREWLAAPQRLDVLNKGA